MAFYLARQQMLLSNLFMTFFFFFFCICCRQLLPLLFKCCAPHLPTWDRAAMCGTHKVKKLAA